jgi:MFS family permease
MLTIFIILLCAHSLGDFLLQTNGMARNKGKWSVLTGHAALHGGLVYVLLQQWQAWQIPVAVALLHWIVDFIKSRQPSSAKAFAWDQAGHVASLALVATGTVHLGLGTAFDGFGWKWIVGLGGFVAVVLGVGYFVGAVADELIAAKQELAQTIKSGLKDGGKQIGRLERALIFAFILVGEPTGIGFLVAAKSILRFEEAKQQPVAEYVIIGTLWSFGLAIVLSWLTLQAINSVIPS